MNYYMHTREGRPAIVQWHSGEAYMPFLGIRSIDLAKYACTSLKKLRAQQVECMLADPSLKSEDLGYVRLATP